MRKFELSRRSALALRFTAYLLPILILAWTWYLRRHQGSAEVDHSWREVDWASYEEVQLLQRYLQIDSSQPDGNEIPAAEFLAGILAKEGIVAEIQRVGPRNANLWARLEGKDPKALALHHHMDTEGPRDPTAWRHPPFGGVIDPPWIYGRGAFDMKSYGIAQLLAMLHLKREGIPLARSVLFLATGDEERSGVHGARYLLETHPEFAQQIWGVLTEGGAIEALDLETIRYWGTEFVQRGFFQIFVCHSEAEPLWDLKIRLGERGLLGERRLIPGIDEFLIRYGKTRDRPVTRELLSEPSRLMEKIRNFPRDIEVTDLPPYIELMLRDQVGIRNPRRVGDSYRLDISLMPLPGKSFAEMKEEFIGDELAGFATQEENWYHTSMSSPLDHPLFVGLDRYMAKARPDTVHGPLFVPSAASEARYFRPAGIPTYGFAPFVFLSGDSAGMKLVDERLPLREYVEGVELYRGLVEALVAEGN